MKISLRPVGDVQLIEVAETVTPHQFNVLRAGVTKLLRDGKNRIVIDLKNPTIITHDVLRELSVLNLLAAELSGSIVLSGVDPATQARINNFARPPVIAAYATSQQAVQALSSAAKKAPKPAAKAPEPIAQPPSGAPAAADGAELAALRRELAQARHENDLLLARLADALMERRLPVNEAAWADRVRALESELSTLSAAAAASPKAKP